MSEEKKRKPNWSKEESLLLAELVKGHKGVLEGKFGPGVTSAKRQEAWQVITENLNAAASHVRTREEVEKKWKNLKSQAKKNFGSFRQETGATGGGPPPTPISPVTGAIVDVIGKDNVTLTGIDQSIDTSSIQLLEILQETDTEVVVTDVPNVMVYETYQTAEGRTNQPEGCSSSAPKQTTDALLREKLLLEIECMKLKRKYLQLKIKKLEE